MENFDRALHNFLERYGLGIVAGMIAFLIFTYADAPLYGLIVAVILGGLVWLVGTYGPRLYRWADRQWK